MNNNNINNNWVSNDFDPNNLRTVVKEYVYGFAPSQDCVYVTNTGCVSKTALRIWVNGMCAYGVKTLQLAKTAAVLRGHYVPDMEDMYLGRRMENLAIDELILGELRMDVEN